MEEVTENITANRSSEIDDENPKTAAVQQTRLTKSIGAHLFSESLLLNKARSTTIRLLPVRISTKQQRFIGPHILSNDKQWKDVDITHPAAPLNHSVKTTYASEINKYKELGEAIKV
jgi:hypothetical protein